MMTEMEPFRRGLLRTAIAVAALCIAPAAYPALAQEGAPAAGGGATGLTAAPDGGAVTGSDIEPFTPRRGSAGLQRRASLKALIANAPNRAAGPPSANVGAGPSPARSGTAAATQRNAIGVAMPGAGVRPQDHGASGVATQAGNRSTVIGTPAGNMIGATRQIPFPSAGPAQRGAGIDGTTMGRRMASGPGSVGGPAKDRSGINGTWMPPRR